MIALVFTNLSSLMWLLPLVGIPLGVHIFNKKFPQHIPFSNIRMIKKSLHERSKLLRLRHIILMVIRTLALLLLLLSFLQPVFSQFSSAEQNDKAERQVIIVLDHSLSMFARGGSLSPHEQGLIEVEKIINSLSFEAFIFPVGTGQ